MCACVRECVWSRNLRASHACCVHSASIGDVHHSDPPPSVQHAHGWVVGSYALPNGGDPLTSSLVVAGSSMNSSSLRMATFGRAMTVVDNSLVSGSSCGRHRLLLGQSGSIQQPPAQ